MERVLVAVADYPNNNGGKALMYVHVRNRYYIENDIEVEVLNFSAKSNYVYDDISVITLQTFKKTRDRFDVLVCHAPNIKNHYLFLRRFINRFDSLIFFYHGHEVLKINDLYPKPYDYVKRTNRFSMFLQNRYDDFKLAIWRKYLFQISEKSEFIFVSNWQYEQFQKYIQLSGKDLQGHVHIINNSVGKVFEENTYNYIKEKQFDFITIRGNLDGSKYCMDVVYELAKNNDKCSFLVIGKGEFFSHYEKPKNITWLEKDLSHIEIVEMLNRAKCALMPTRLDAQGVMVCEMATFGIPVLTSDIDICREISRDFKNFYLISNDNLNMDLSIYLKSSLAGKSLPKCNKYFREQTVGKEVMLIKKKVQ